MDMTRSYESQSIFLSVCIVTYRRPALLEKCLDCIAPGRQTLDPSLYEVIISDDCSEQSARSVVEDCGFARWIQGPSRGIAMNRNNVAEAALGDWIVYVDDDELPLNDWLSAIYREASTGNWDVIQGCVESLEYPDSILWYAPIVKSAGIICTANLGIRRSSLFEIGGFDIRLTTSHEDVELGLRIKDAGLRTLYLEQARVLHPARRITLPQVIKRTIQQQCQSYVLHSGSTKTGWKHIPTISFWSLKYVYRTFKMQIYATGFSHWKMLLMHTLIRSLCCPVACFRLVFAESPLPFPYPVSGMM
jgi:glycosyltransferase involved in cell wall biosynthesis